MENSAYISVIIPCYNGEAFIESAILSVLRQPVDNIELIVVNDGSTDGTSLICQQYSDRIRYIETDNLGAGHARNVGLNSATGTWIMFLDSDDLYLLNAINDVFVRNLQLLESDGYEIIYTPKIKCDIALRQFIKIDYAENSSDIEFFPKNEFVYCVYLKAYLDNHRIRFFEYRKQDIETAFRYLAFSYAPKVATRNDIKFYLQRDNLQSNTHTWNKQTLHSVKAKVYYDLFENFSNERSRSLLFETVIEEIHSYFADVLHNGYMASDTYQEVTHLVNQYRVHDCILCHSKTGRRHFYTNIAMSLLLGGKKAKQALRETPKKTQHENIDEVFLRLSYITQFVSSSHNQECRNEKS